MEADENNKGGRGAVERRPRNPRMDALVKHFHESERYSFQNVAAAVSEAVASKQRHQKTSPTGADT